MAALDSLTYNFTPSRSWTAALNRTGQAFNPLSSPSNISTPVVSLSTAQAAAAVGGADLVASFIQTIAASGNATIDLTAVTDFMLRASQAFARLKVVEFWLLTLADDPTNGTACSSVTIGNAGSNANLLFLSSATPTLDLLAGDYIAWTTRRAAGKVVDSTHKNVKILNNDATYAAAVLCTFVGGTV